METSRRCDAGEQLDCMAGVFYLMSAARGDDELRATGAILEDAFRDEGDNLCPYCPVRDYLNEHP